MMTDREKHLSLALDALVQVRETLETYQDDVPGWAFHTARGRLDVARRHIEAAAMPKPSVLRRWFGREGRAA
jgi:hypothetical protein